MKLSNDQILKNKQEFIMLLSSVQREGIQDLLNWLQNNSDFFEAPSSTQYHGCYKGGLCEHSLNVYHTAKKLIDTFKYDVEAGKLDNISEETIIISALLHDMCKVNFYQSVTKVFKDDTTGLWHHYNAYQIIKHDPLPLGHAEKSLAIIQNFIKLTPTEMVSIRWHMGMSDVGVWLSEYSKFAMNEAVTNCPLTEIIMLADSFASRIIEKECDPKVECLID